ncbi:MAG: hypothetical protein AB8H79_05635 [Myxococcota bacterium]
MDPSTLVQQAIGSLTVSLVLTFLAVIASVTIGALLLGRRSVPPGVSGLVMGLPALSLLGLSVWAGWGVAPENASSAVASGIFVLLVAPFFALVPALMHGLLVVGAGLRDGPRRWARGGVAAGLIVVVTGLPLAVGAWVGHGFFEIAWLRVLPYGLLGMLTALAMCGGPERTEAVASAGLAFCGFVGVSEAAVRGVFYFLALGRFNSLPDPESRLAMLQNAQADMLQPAVLGSGLILVFALAVGVLGLVPAVRRSPKPGSWAGSVWLLVFILPLLFADVSIAAWSALAQALGSS